MSIESENKSVLRLRNELSKLKTDLAKAQKELTSFENKKTSAEAALRKTNLQQNQNLMKLRDMQSL